MAAYVKKKKIKRLLNLENFINFIFGINFWFDNTDI